MNNSVFHVFNLVLDKSKSHMARVFTTISRKFICKPIDKVNSYHHNREPMIDLQYLKLAHFVLSHEPFVAQILNSDTFNDDMVLFYTLHMPT